MYNSLIYSEKLFTKVWYSQNLFISLSIIKIKNMRQTEQKALDYLKSNPIVANFIEKVNKERKEYYDKINLSSKEPDLVVEIGNKFIRLWQGTSCWGFISRVDGDLKGSPIKKGDLLKAATWKAPAKHSRGNIMDGTARYGVYGPEYL
jgi:hypothetical protein